MMFTCHKQNFFSRLYEKYEFIYFFTCNFQLLFRCNRNVMKFVFLYAADAFLPFLDEGKEQRMVAASCVFPRNAMLSTPPSFLICVLLSGGW